MKVAILHDHFLYSGGGERLVTLLAKGIKADLYTGFFNPNSLDPKSLGFDGKFKTLTKPLLEQGLRHFKMMYIFFTKTKFLNDYDTVILSGNCLEAVNNIKKANKIYYCHTPPRYLFDKYNYHLAQKTGLQKLLFMLFVPLLRWIYINNLKKIDKIVVNSKCVQERLKKFTGFDSEIVYPPVDTSYFVPGDSKGYYLSYARLTEIKRVHLIVEAFTKLPDKKLIVTFNPSDPYLETIKKLIEGHNNIELKYAPGNDIIDIVSHCIATIYIPIDEDFGMTPVESMSAGKPVIGVNEGGLKETIIDLKTGILLKPNFEIKDICDAVLNLNQDKCNSMKKDCIERAKEFSLEIFISRMLNIING